jgi:hypothetical protein
MCGTGYQRNGKTILTGRRANKKGCSKTLKNIFTAGFTQSM